MSRVPCLSGPAFSRRDSKCQSHILKCISFLFPRLGRCAKRVLSKPKTVRKVLGIWGAAGWWSLCVEGSPGGASKHSEVTDIWAHPTPPCNLRTSSDWSHPVSKKAFGTSLNLGYPTDARHLGTCNCSPNRTKGVGLDRKLNAGRRVRCPGRNGAENPQNPAPHPR